MWSPDGLLGGLLPVAFGGQNPECREICARALFCNPATSGVVARLDLPERSSHLAQVLETSGEHLDAIETSSDHGGPREAS